MRFTILSSSNRAKALWTVVNATLRRLVAVGIVRKGFSAKRSTSFEGTFEADPAVALYHVWIRWLIRSERLQGVFGLPGYTVQEIFNPSGPLTTLRNGLQAIIIVSLRRLEESAQI